MCALKLAGCCLSGVMLSAAVLASTPSVAAEPAPQRPNIIVILSDDKY